MTVPVRAGIFAALALLSAACRGAGDGASPESDPDSYASSAVVGSGGAAPPMSVQLTYTVAPGDTLVAIASRFDATVEELMAANGIRDPDAIYVGQELNLHLVPQREGPAIHVLPDSELVYGPAYLDFDIAGFVSSMPGHLARHSEMVDGLSTSGAEIVARVAWEYSVGPRVLLAFLEAQSSWVAGVPSGPGLDYPAGLVDPVRSGLWWQLTWLADQLNSGYYDWKTRGSRVLRLSDGALLAGSEELGPGSFAVHRALAPISTESQLADDLASFSRAYESLFGDPWSRAHPSLDPTTVSYPELRLPWAEGEAWWYTGGPHGGWAEGSAWAALDFVPDEEARGCFISDRWATAVANGRLIHGGAGELWLDLDGDGVRQTGPVVLYLHLSSQDIAEDRAQVAAGDRLGHPSCEGGMSQATHLHLARLYDGEWLAADGRSPFVIGGWRAVAAASPYDGSLVHADGRERVACECRETGYNDVRW